MAVKSKYLILYKAICLQCGKVEEVDVYQLYPEGWPVIRINYYFENERVERGEPLAFCCREHMVTYLNEHELEVE